MIKVKCIKFSENWHTYFKNNVHRTERLVLKGVLWHLYTYLYMNAHVAQKHIYVYTKLHFHIYMDSERHRLFLRQQCQSCKALQLSYEKIWPLTHLCLSCVGIMSALFCRFYKTLHLGGKILSIWNILGKRQRFHDAVKIIKYNDQRTQRLQEVQKMKEIS